MTTIYIPYGYESPCGHTCAVSLSPLDEGKPLSLIPWSRRSRCDFSTRVDADHLRWRRDEDFFFFGREKQFFRWIFYEFERERKCVGKQGKSTGVNNWFFFLILDLRRVRACRFVCIWRYSLIALWFEGVVLVYNTWVFFVLLSDLSRYLEWYSILILMVESFIYDKIH